MKGRELLDKMELISPEYIEQAQRVPVLKKKFKITWIAVAACVCLLVFGLMNVGDENPGLPEISLGNDYGARGFESYKCYDVSGLTDGNPWNECMALSSLPVYKNRAFDPSRAGVPRGMDINEMKEIMHMKVTAVNAEILSTEVYTDDKDDDHVTEIKAVTDKGIIIVSADGMVEYRLSDCPGLKFIDGTEEEALDYYADYYKTLLGFENYARDICVEYNIYGQTIKSLAVYDSADDDTGNILGYNFSRAEFIPDDDGNLYMIRIHDTLGCAEKIGDYPIISRDHAEELLSKGYYATSTSREFPGAEFIGKTELVYLTGPGNEYLLPYYRFYVLMADMTDSETGLKTYGTYYVPAVEKKYIRDMSVYNGDVN